MNNEILEPVICMAILTFFMMIWMYATRIPASKTLEDQGVNLEDLSHPSKLGGVFPSKVERVADNYNHLSCFFDNVGKLHPVFFPNLFYQDLLCKMP